MFDVFIFPSLYEGLPVSLIEAQAAGLKVYASDTITREVEITDSIEFLSIDENSKFWADKVLANTFKKTDNHQKIVNSGYDIKSNTEKLEEFYQKINVQ